MSSYFDSFDKDVREMSKQVRGEDFANALEAMEEGMIKDCEYFAGDLETPVSVRKCIMAVISLGGVKHSPKAREMAKVSYLSTLSRDMHGLFHDIARMRYQMRYGLVFDDPAEAVRARDRFVEELGGKAHPWQKKSPPLHPELALNDAPGYCRKAAVMD